MAVGGRVVVNQAAIDRLVSSPAGPTGRAMVRLAERATQAAKAVAPVGKPSRTPAGHPSGYQRSQIGWNLHVDGGDIVVDVLSPALTSQANPYPGPGKSYPLQQEDPSRVDWKVPPPFAGVGPSLVPAVLGVVRGGLR